MIIHPAGVFDNQARAYEHIVVEELAAAMGAEVKGVDLAAVTDEQFAEIEHALFRHKMIFFRDQRINHADHESFSLRFGDFADDAYTKGVEGHVNIQPVIKEAGTEVAMIFGSGWHTDSAFLPNPPAISMLYGVDIPPTRRYVGRARYLSEDARASEPHEKRERSLNQHMPELPLIDRVKITADLLVPIIKQMESELGSEQAHGIVRRGVSARFREMARSAMAETGGNPMRALVTLNSGVRQGVDIETDVRPQPDGFDMDVTDCVYARFFKELGEPELGFLLLCSADFDQVAEMPSVELMRTQTIMQGADHCDFRYRLLDRLT